VANEPDASDNAGEEDESQDENRETSRGKTADALPLQDWRWERRWRWGQGWWRLAVHATRALQRRLSRFKLSLFQERELPTAFASAMVSRLMADQLPSFSYLELWNNALQSFSWVARSLRQR
jgi:hypothetical protein